ncbi:MAG TPA: ATP-dependent zinc metalloprotease FtsH [Thermomicrobiales bacterium]|jgi:cell division protease FtsH|nr:ATP-dependent zinc metalloprotease FtsH [Thermomicrobiales bacterium]
MGKAKSLRSSFVYIAVGVLVVVLLLAYLGSGDRTRDVSLDQLAADINAGTVSRLVQSDGSSVIEIRYSGAQEDAEARVPPNTDILSVLSAYQVDPSTVTIEVEQGSRWGGILRFLPFLLPTLLLIGFFAYMMRQSQGNSSQAMSFGKSKARLFTSNRPTVTFADVAGVDEAKEELQEVVEFLKYPDKFAALGARIPRGVLLVGPPGTGKTLLSRAVAGEAGVPFFSISGSEFVEMFVGVGASRVRDLFDQAKKNSPCIVFVDEIDAVGRQRGAGLGGSHDEREQTLNQILVEMDGFDSSINVIIIAATNRPDVLDPALLRPGRFDRQVILDRPDIQGRRSILQVHSRGKPLEDSVSIENLARQTSGFSGADLENLVNEAAILAARRNKKTIGVSELTEAIDRVLAGPQRKSRVISERERLMTAYHEAGHALVARMLPNSDPVRKVSIVARGMMGGYTRVVPDEDRLFMTKSQFRDRLAVFMAGHATETMVFEEQSTGASNDIEQATAIARRMVTEFGMSRTLGPRAYGKKEEMVFLGREINESRNYSDEIAESIDREIRELIDEAHDRARAILEEHAVYLEAIAQLLLANETIEGDEMEALFDGPRPTPDLVGPPHGRPSGRMAQVHDRHQTPAGHLPPGLQPPRERAEDRPSGVGGLRPNPAS